MKATRVGILVLLAFFAASAVDAGVLKKRFEGIHGINFVYFFFALAATMQRAKISAISCRFRCPLNSCVYMIARAIDSS